MRTTRLRRTAGGVLMAASVVLGLLPVAAAAQEAGGDQDAAAEASEAETSRTGYWNAAITGTIPSALTKTFPPEALCLVQPAACNTDNETVNDLLDQLGTGLSDGVATLQDADPGLPADAVPPDTLPVSVLGGKPYFRAAFELVLPEVPQGEQVDQFVVVLEQTDPTFNFASPALRQAVLASLTCARETETGAVGGRCEQEEFAKVLSQGCDEGEDGPCVDDGERLGVEACPIADDPTTEDADASWQEGTSQDGDTVPEADCLFGALGVPVELADRTVWTFDLTLAAQAWNDGTLDNKGVLLRPQAAENFAFGDAETTFNKQVTYLDTVAVAQSTSTPPPPPAPLPPLEQGSAPPPPPPASTSSGSDPFFQSPAPQGAPATTASPTQPGAPAAAPGGEAAAPAAPQVPADDQPLAGVPVDQPLPGTPWTVWLLAIPFAAGAALFSRSLGAPVVAAGAAATGDGAMTRLLELRRRSVPTSDLVTG